MSFGDDAARVLASAGLSRPVRRPGRRDKAENLAMAAMAYEAAHARRAAELGGQYQPGQMFNSCLDMLGDDDD
jgi:hypothetical protein